MSAPATSPRRQAIAGFQDMSPVILGAIPFGVVYGVAAASSGLPDIPALVMSAAVFAGAAQIAGVQLIGQGASIFIVLLTTFIINLRFVMYSASLAPHFKHLPGGWKMLLAYLMTDQAYAFGITRFAKDPDQAFKRWYFLGNAATLWPVWLLSSAAGIFLGAQIPASWGLEFSVPLIFMALIFPAITDRPSALAGLVAALVAVAAYELPFNLNLILAALVGILTGILAENRAKRA